jgi:hypothetical protein
MRDGFVVLLMATAIVAGCERRDGGWTPVLEGTMPAYLETELERVTEEVRAARSAPAESASRLEEAERRLVNLTGVYLPLYRAKVDASNAYRHHEMGDDAEAGRALDRVESMVAAVSRETAGTLEAELERVSGEVARARVALEAGSGEAGGDLRRLAELLNDLITRAGLIL